MAQGVAAGWRTYDKADPSWFWDWNESIAATSPGHEAWQRLVATFVDKELLPNIAEWEEQGNFPPDLHERAYAAGVYGAGQPAEYGGTAPAKHEHDTWHSFIFADEMARVCSGGLMASLFTFHISLPPILAVGTPEQKQLYVRGIVTGRKVCSLAITEPGGGSDVSAMQTRAVKQGDSYLLDGVKTFISGGMNANYFTVGARTGGEGFGGISLFMVPRESPGVTTTRMKTQGWHCSTTTTVAFDGVVVPASNLLGQENAGFLPIMLNFNNERYGIAVQCNRMSRCCLEDAIRYARVRKTFGRRLISHQVIRHKAAEMARHILATHGLMMMITRAMAAGEDIGRLAGQVSVAKVQATRTFEFCAREASQILGGKSYLRGDGPGGRIERCYREVRVFAIGGGSEEIMLELAAKQAKL